MPMRSIRSRQSAATTAKPQQRERVELVRWLIDDFLRRDLGKLPAADWSRLQKELDHLTWKLVGGGTVFPVTWLEQLASERLTFLEERLGERRFRAHLPKLKRKEMRQVQAHLRQVLKDLRPIDSQRGPPPVMYPSIPGVIKRVHLVNDRFAESGLGIKRVYGADWCHLRWLAIATLLEECGEQIARCLAPGCTQLFLRNRRQEYCSRSCSQKVRSSTWYEAHREDAKERRRQSYRREVELKHPGARVRTQKPRRPAYVPKEYPGWRYHRDCPEGQLVNNAEEATALGAGWCDTPDPAVLKAAAGVRKKKRRPPKTQKVQRNMKPKP